jgi:hypothetical protein
VRQARQTSYYMGTYTYLQDRLFVRYYGRQYGMYLKVWFFVFLLSCLINRQGVEKACDKRVQWLTTWAQAHTCIHDTACKVANVTPFNQTQRDYKSISFMICFVLSCLINRQGVERACDKRAKRLASWAHTHTHTHTHTHIHTRVLALQK